MVIARQQTKYDEYPIPDRCWHQLHRASICLGRRDVDSRQQTDRLTRGRHRTISSLLRRPAAQQSGQADRELVAIMRALLCLAVTILLPAHGFAHAMLERAEPPVGGEVSAPPRQLVLTFSEGV